LLSDTTFKGRLKKRSEGNDYFAKNIDDTKGKFLRSLSANLVETSERRGLDPVEQQEIENIKNYLEGGMKDHDEDPAPSIIDFTNDDLKTVLGIDSVNDDLKKK